METQSTSIPISELLSHEPWLRRVVVDLVSESEADDILQETWIAALSARDIAHPRAWLRGVAQNLARLRRRSEARRQAREAGVARDEAVASTDTIVERLHAHRELAEAVAALDEPYRTVVLLRYFEELSPREIASRQGLPASTVRTQIDRGLRMVRGRFEGRDVRALAILVLIPRHGEPVAPVSVAGKLLTWGVGVLAMSLRNKILAAAILIASLSSLSFFFNTDSTKPAGELTTAQKVSVPVDSVVKVEPVNRSEVGLLAPAVSVPVPRIEEPRLRGLVLNAHGVPVEGVSLRLYLSGTPVVTTVYQGVAPMTSGPHVDLGVSDHEGRFSALVGHEGGQIQASGDYLSIRFSVPATQDRDTEEALVVVARRTSIAGRVVDADGKPLSKVSVVPILDGLLDFAGALDHTNQLGLAVCRTDQDGAFRLEDIPELPELELRVNQGGYENKVIREIAGRQDLLIRLSPVPEGAYRVSGTVVDHRGRLVPGAMVLLNQTTAVTGRFGEFSLKTRFLSEESGFGACLPGFQPAIRPDVVASLLEGHAIAPVTLRLGGPALEIRGQVVDMEGEALAGMTLTILDATRVDSWQTVEDFVAGRKTEPTNTRGMVMRADSITDDEGKFTIVGLTDRPYQLRIFDPESLASHTIELAAGARDVVLYLDPQTRRKISGVVQSSSGRALTGVSVRWGLMTLEGPGLEIFAPGTATTTDEKGEFSLSDVPMGDAIFSLSGSGIVDLNEHLLGVESGSFITITPRAKCRVRVQLTDTSATRVQFLDDGGTVVAVKRTMGQMSFGGDGWDLKSGKTPVLEVSDAAVTLVVLRDGEEVTRYAIVLGDAEVSTLRF